jgi:hypothetical protein
LFKPYGNYSRQFGDDLEPVYESPDLLAISLNTTRRYRHAHGEVSRGQVERTAARLARATSRQLRLVIVHQPVCVTRDEDEPERLRGHSRAVHRWSAAGADLIMGGHIHLPFVCALHERYTDLPRHTFGVQAGTAVSRRLRQDVGNSVNILRYASTATARTCAVERWDFVAAAAAFAPVSVDNLRFDRRDDRR